MERERDEDQIQADGENGTIKVTEIKFKQDLVNVLYKNRTKT